MNALAVVSVGQLLLEPPAFEISMSYSKLFYHISYVSCVCALVSFIYHYARVYTADTFRFLPDGLPRWYVLRDKCRRGFAVLLVGFFASALIGNYHERQKLRKRLQTEQRLGEDLFDTARRLMKEDFEKRVKGFL